MTDDAAATDTATDGFGDHVYCRAHGSHSRNCDMSTIPPAAATPTASGEKSIEELIEASSLGSPDAVAARSRAKDEDVARVLAEVAAMRGAIGERAQIVAWLRECSGCCDPNDMDRSRIRSAVLAVAADWIEAGHVANPPCTTGEVADNA